MNQEPIVKEAIILAGGFGTRLQQVISDLPKPMAPIADKPFLYYLLRHLSQFGIRHFILSTHHLADKIQDYFGKQFENADISYAHEETPLGTGGGIRHSLSFAKEEQVLVLNGDSFLSFDPISFYQAHLHHQSKASLVVCETTNAARYGTVSFDQDKRLIGFKEKTGKEEAGWINSGIYLLHKSFYLQHTPADKAFSIENNFFDSLCPTLPMYVYPSSGYFIDIGLPASYQQAQHELPALFH